MSAAPGAASAERIAQDIWAVQMPSDGHWPKYTLTYVIRDSEGGTHLIDPGWDTVDARSILLEAFDWIGLRPESIRSLLMTHTHRDHFGVARDLRAGYGAEIVMHPIEAENLGGGSREPGWTSYQDVRSRCARQGVPESRRAEIVAAAEYSRSNFPGDVSADLLVEDGEALPIPGRSIRALWTPGHTAGHLCFIDDAAGVIFTGDHVLPKIHPGYGLGSSGRGNPLRAYLASLEDVKVFDDLLVAPGHEYVFRGLSARAAEIASYHLRRVDEVGEQLRLGVDRIWDIASRVTWSVGFENLSGNGLRLALNQVEHIVDFTGAAARES